MQKIKQNDGKTVLHVSREELQQMIAMLNETETVKNSCHMDPEEVRQLLKTEDAWNYFFLFLWLSACNDPPEREDDEACLWMIRDWMKKHVCVIEAH